MLAKDDKKNRIQKIKNILPMKYFHEPDFDTNKRSKILCDLSFSKSVLESNLLFYNSHILTKQEEQHLFRKYNYFKYRIFKLTSKANISLMKDSGLSEIEKNIRNMQQVRDIIIKCNTRLMVKPVSKFFSDGFNREEFICNSYLHIIRAIDYFDYRMGFKFSTYYVKVLIRNLARDNKYLKRDTRGIDVYFDEIDKKKEDFKEVNDPYNKAFIEDMLKKLDVKFGKKSRTIIIKKTFGVCGYKKQTLEEIGKQLDLTKERIRQIRDKYLQELEKLSLSYDPLV